MSFRMCHTLLSTLVLACGGLLLIGCKGNEPGPTTAPAQVTVATAAHAESPPTTPTPNASAAISSPPLPKPITTPFSFDPVDVERFPEESRGSLRAAEQKAKDNPRSADAVGDLGIEYLAHDLSFAAASCFDYAVAAAPGETRWLYMQAVATERMGKRNQALSQYRTLLTREPNHVGVNRSYGLLLAKINPTQAATILEPLSLKYPDDAWSYLGRAKIALAGGRKTAAYNLLTKAVTKAPNWLEAREELLKLARESNLKDVIARYEAPIENPEEPEFLGDPILEDLRKRSEKSHKAVLLARAQAGQNSSESASESKGLLSSGARQFIQAVAEREKQLQAAIEADPKNVTALNELSEMLRDRGLIRQSVELSQKAVRDLPQELMARVALVLSYVAAGNYPEALSEAKKAQAIAPNDWRSDYLIALALSKVGGSDKEALDYAQSAKKRQPKASIVHCMEGILLSRNGDPVGAETAIQNAISLDPRIADNYIAFVSLPSRRDSREGCERVIREVGLKVQPNSAKLYNALAKLLLSTSNPTPADSLIASQAAEGACLLTERNHAAYLDTLAVAQANAGEFDDAMVTAKAALAVAEKNGPENILPSIRQHIGAFQRKERITKFD